RKKSHITLTAGSGEAGDLFTKRTRVTSVEDRTNAAKVIQWDVDNPPDVKANGHKLRIKLTGRGLPKELKDNPPDAGTLTVTLTDGPPVDPVPVVYVEDESP